jgi:hypothetical protein
MGMEAGVGIWVGIGMMLVLVRDGSLVWQILMKH